MPVEGLLIIQYLVDFVQLILVIYHGDKQRLRLMTLCQSLKNILATLHPRWKSACIYYREVVRMGNRGFVL
jgi:hypothetical protein